MQRLLLAIFACVVGCVARPTTQAISVSQTPETALIATTAPTEFTFDPELEARICPPPGWRQDPDKKSPSHLHRVWVSPTGDTAYGIIRFKLPLPVTNDMALWGFMREMKRSQGDAVLVEKSEDAEAGVLRFVAEGGIYKVRSRLSTSGFRGWSVYAGTLRGKTDNVPELAQAIASREATVVNVTK